MTFWMRTALFIVIICLFPRCTEGVLESVPDPVVSSVPTCTVSRLRYPTTREEFQTLYVGRGFYADGNHLGRDIRLSEGTAIYPIACGTVRVYRPANGYGTLVVVIEHRLARATVVRNGLGELTTVTSFLSIYGHLRSTALPQGGRTIAVRQGDTVGQMM